jgi:hypothetical protein
MLNSGKVNFMIHLTTMWYVRFCWRILCGKAFTIHTHASFWYMIEQFLTVPLVLLLLSFVFVARGKTSSSLLTENHLVGWRNHGNGI